MKQRPFDFGVERLPKKIDKIKELGGRDGDGGGRGGLHAPTPSVVVVAAVVVAVAAPPNMETSDEERRRRRAAAAPTPTCCLIRVNAIFLCIFLFFPFSLKCI